MLNRSCVDDVDETEYFIQSFYPNIFFTLENEHGIASNRRPDTTKLLDEIDNNRSYAVFISYCEIYNTYIYDLLEDTRDTVTGRPK